MKATGIGRSRPHPSSSGSSALNARTSAPEEPPANRQRRTPRWCPFGGSTTAPRSRRGGEDTPPPCSEPRCPRQRTALIGVVHRRLRPGCRAVRTDNLHQRGAVDVVERPLRGIWEREINEPSDLVVTPHRMTAWSVPLGVGSEERHETLDVAGVDGQHVIGPSAPCTPAWRAAPQPDPHQHRSPMHTSSGLRGG